MYICLGYTFFILFQLITVDSFSKMLLKRLRIINKMTNRTSPKNIRHLVISGGANGGFAYLGALNYLEKNNFFSMSNIETIYATSIGTYIAIFITIGYEWGTIKDFLIKRPWNSVYKVNIDTIVKSIYSGGIFDKTAIIKTFKPLLEAKGLSINVTLMEYYEYSNKEIHYFATNINDYKIVDFSHITHPEWKLLDVIYASSCLPFLFPPLEVDGILYFDGASLLNYPLSKAIERGFDKEEILGICKKYDTSDSNEFSLLKDSNSKLINYIFLLFKQLWRKTRDDQVFDNVPYQLEIDFSNGFIEIVKILEDEYERSRLIDLGYNSAIAFLDKHNFSHS